MIKFLKESYGWIFVLIGFISLYLISMNEYLVFHFISETFTIVIAGAVFVITINTQKYFKNKYMIYIGISYFFIALLDLFHTLTYKGMPIYQHLNYPANQLWIAARYYESIMLLLAFGYFYGRELNIRRTYVINTIVTVVILSTILVFQIFPDCYIEGVGLTPFKKISEYIISGILITTMVFIWKNKKDYSKKQYVYLNIVLISTIISELLFTFYISNYGISNLFGHYFKVISFIFVYLLIIQEGLRDPYSLIFKELEEKRLELEQLADYDPLTNLPNRRSLIHRFETIWLQARRDKKEISTFLIDIDDFKDFNDAFGHSHGDEILIAMSKILHSSCRRPLDIVSRHGGEEFVIVFYDCNYEGAEQKAKEIHNLISTLDYKNLENKQLTVSIGFTTTKYIKELSLTEIIKKSDEQMYNAKEQGKNRTSGVII